MGDGSILPDRKYIADGLIHHGIDAVHMSNGCHYMSLAQDLNVFNSDGEWLKEGNEPIWAQAGGFWESLSSLCRWGGRFDDPDPNHFSITHDGKA